MTARHCLHIVCGSGVLAGKTRRGIRHYGVLMWTGPDHFVVTTIFLFHRRFGGPGALLTEAPVTVFNHKD